MLRWLTQCPCFCSIRLWALLLWRRSRSRIIGCSPKLALVTSLSKAISLCHLLQTVITKTFSEICFSSSAHTWSDIVWELFIVRHSTFFLMKSTPINRTWYLSPKRTTSLQPLEQKALRILWSRYFLPGPHFLIKAARGRSTPAAE